MSRYGDTPLGMVESALEFLRICEDLNYYDVVLSMKASNTQVMVQAYRLLVQKLDEEGLQPYPLHLGVTEAGDGEDGRIKSAVGIGTLLEDGLGDTVRVSLTEEPEYEVPVAYHLVKRYDNRAPHQPILPVEEIPKDPYSYSRRRTHDVANIGGDNVPRVITDVSAISEWSYRDLKHVGHFYLPELDKWTMNDQGCDYVYTGQRPIDFMLPNGLKEIRDFDVWQQQDDQQNKYPLFQSLEVYQRADVRHQQLNFLHVRLEDWSEGLVQILKSDNTLVLLLDTENKHAMPEQRRFFF
jgi:(E)-4-hydroxy-3-methylbut-2-enyl-diphosphate synthase